MCQRGKRKSKHISHGIKGLGFVLPSLIGILVFSVLPFINVIKLSFSNLFTGEWVGFQNYEMVMNNHAFCLALKNMIVFLCLCVPLLCVLSFGLSAGINSLTEHKNWMKTLFLTPMILPVCAVVLLSKVLFDVNGFLNELIETNIDWLNSSYAIWALVALYIWKNLGYTILLWCAVLERIPKAIYEASALDGASKGQQLRYITLPCVKTSGFVIVVISIINSFKVFRESYLLAGNYPNESIYMTQNIFNNWFAELAIDKISAGAVIMVVFIGCFVFLLERLWKSEEY